MHFNHTLIIQPQNFGHRFTDRDFELPYWRKQNISVELPGGRGASQKIILNGAVLVLRQYRRGGVVSHFLKDQYLWMGLKRSRPYRENRIVEQAIGANIPVAQIAAYRVERCGLYYRAAIISHYIENRGTLADCLQQSALDTAQWFKLGQLIRRMHQAGIFHADLNANNILLDDSNDFHLLDFDKAVSILPDSPKAQKNLQRLLRSLHKIAAKNGQGFHFNEADWKSLLSGYQSREQG